MAREATTALRRGWTTGACAAAAARAAFTAMLTGRFPDPVSIRLPRGGMASFPLELAELGDASARAGVTKDAGDDPDVTDGALVIVETAWAPPGSGIGFAAGEGVGMVTRAGLPLAVGEPAINPAPRAMIRGTLMGGLSILGTTGVVVPYSCASWIHAIHRGIDVARAAGLEHIAAATGATSEHAVQRLYSLPDHALIDMGDFAGATLKYLRRHPVARLTIAGGFAKLAKLAAGHLDLHSARSRVDMAALAMMLSELGVDASIAQAAEKAAGAAEILALAGGRREPLAAMVAARAREVALATLCGKTAVEVAIVDRQGGFLARVGG